MASKRERASLLYATRSEPYALISPWPRFTFCASRFTRNVSRLPRDSNPDTGSFMNSCRQGPDFLVLIIGPLRLAPMNGAFDLLLHGGSLHVLTGYPFGRLEQRFTFTLVCCISTL